MALLSSLFVCLLLVLERTCDGFAVVGYVPEWRFDGIPFETIIPSLTHIILFSIEVDSEARLVQLDRLPSKEKMKEIKQLSLKSDTKLMVSFGGNGRSNGFPKVSKLTKLRVRFVENTIKFMDEYKLDGIDLNWEYPSNRDEWAGLFKIMMLFRSKKPGIILSIAFYPGQEKILNTMIKRHHMQSRIDLFLMMSYDNIRNGQEKHSTYQFAVDTVKSAIDGGLPRDKVCLGLPFYARHMKTGDWKTYEEIVRDLREEKGMKDEEIKGIDEWEGHYYNGYDMIVKKTKYALDEGIGGVMIWENGQDVHGDELSLLGAIRRTVDGGLDEGEKEEL